MQRYLADKYMSGPKADAILARDPTVKKKKRKQGTGTTTSGGVEIVDDDGGWGRPVKNDADDDEQTDVIVASDRSFKKRRKVAAGDDGGWVSLTATGEPITEQPPPEAEDEKPVVVGEVEPPRRKGGLLSQAELQKQFASQVVDKGDDGPTPEQMETVYRDERGRKIDTKAAKAEAARLKREEQEKEARRMEWGKGVVQREEIERRNREMEMERGHGFERSVAPRRVPFLILTRSYSGGVMTLL
jgi:pre-mRNA-splicing factor CWC26